MTEGIVYIASGEKYTNEAIESAHSVREVMPEVNITIFSDRHIGDEVFDSVELYDGFNKNQGDSIIRPEMFPYEKCLFLDSDTYVTSDIGELFTALERFDLAFTHSPGRQKARQTPSCIPEYNTGVIAYHDTPKTKQLFADWYDNYKEQVEETGSTRNQATFSQTIWESDVKFLILPREYNVRVPRAAYLAGKAKIIHGRHWEGLGQVAQRLNDTDRPRVYYREEFLGPKTPKIIDDRGFRHRIQNSVQQDGVYSTGKKIAFKLFPI